MSGFHWNGTSLQFSLCKNRMERRSHCVTSEKWVGGAKFGITHVPTHSVSLSCVYILFWNLIHTSQKTRSNLLPKKWLILWREIISVYFKNDAKQTNGTCAKKRGNFIHKWVAYTVNTGLWKFGITMCLYSMVCWVTAAKCGLWTNGIKQELALQETDRLHAFGL